MLTAQIRLAWGAFLVNWLDTCDAGYGMNQLFTGKYGFVIEPDFETNALVRDLAEEIAPRAEFHVEIPHITLYHAALKNAPVSAITEVHKKLLSIVGRKLVLRDIQVFGSKFLFWNTEKTDWLQSAHITALELSDYFDAESVSLEGLDLTPNQRENLLSYGSPIVRDEYLPHITLAYSETTDVFEGIPSERVHEMTVGRVSFVELGKYGAVTRVVEI